MYLKTTNSDTNLYDLTPSVGMAVRSTVLALWHSIEDQPARFTMWLVLASCAIAILFLLFVSFVTNWSGFINVVVAG